MTDFIVYISAQQRMQAVFKEPEAEEARRPRHGANLRRARVDAARQKVSVALYRLADAIRPLGEATGAPLSVSR